MMEKVRARFEVLDERFARVNGDDWMRRLYTGCRWTEGPAYFPAGRYLVFSDIPNDRMLRWDETTGAVGVFRQPSELRQRAHGRPPGPAGQLRAGHPPGHPHRTRRHRSPCSPTGTRATGSTARTTWSNAPTARSGSPTRATASTATTRATRRRRARSAPATSTASTRPAARSAVVADDFDRPNGLAFSADERTLYIVGHAGASTSAGSTLPPTATSPAARCSPPATAGSFDGLRLDDDRAGSGPPPTTACTASRRTAPSSASCTCPRSWPNLTFGGPRRNELFITASTSVYALNVNVNGVAYPA